MTQEDQERAAVQFSDAGRMSNTTVSINSLTEERLTTALTGKGTEDAFGRIFGVPLQPAERRLLVQEIAAGLYLHGFEVRKRKKDDLDKFIDSEGPAFKRKVKQLSKKRSKKKGKK